MGKNGKCDTFVTMMKGQRRRINNRENRDDDDDDASEIVKVRVFGLGFPAFWPCLRHLLLLWYEALIASRAIVEEEPSWACCGISSIDGEVGHSPSDSLHVTSLLALLNFLTPHKTKCSSGKKNKRDDVGFWRNELVRSLTTNNVVSKKSPNLAI